MLIKETTKLFDNQKSNVFQLTHRRRALLTDKVGSGKTLSILYSFALLKEAGKLNNLLVLTPKSAYAKCVWKNDILKFTNMKCIDVEELYRLSEHSVARLKKLMLQYDVIYGKHTHVKSMLRFMEAIASQPNCMLCVDEVHACKNPKADVTLNMRQVASRTNSFWGITGSTISRSLEDFYNIVNLIYPWYFGSFNQFRETYCICREKCVGYAAGRKKKVLQIIGVKDEEAFINAISPIVVQGESFLSVKFHYIDYNLDSFEQSLYRKIARGMFVSEGASDEDWFKQILSTDELDVPAPKIKDVDLYSSRFLYLQSATDGIITETGEQIREGSTKMNLLINKLREIVSKGESCIVYFDYYASLNVAKSMISKSGINAVVLESTGDHVLKDTDVTEAKCKVKPHIILGTKASSESASYYFINHVIFFHIPTVPSTFVQFVGRITRKNTKFPDDLNAYIFRSENIDLYKMLVVSAKAYQMQFVQGEERNIPDTYKKTMSKIELLDQAKKLLLWNN